MDWFETITGFKEAGYFETQNRLKVEGERLISRVNGRSFGIGRLEIVSLKTLRERGAAVKGLRGTLKVQNVSGDVGEMHQMREHRGALFQVASQFNLLEMVSPGITPEAGVTGYAWDHTQGPACAIAAGAATIYRNYFVPLETGVGQTSHRQVDCLAGVGAALAQALQRPIERLWTMKNGYALCSESGLPAIETYLEELDESAAYRLQGQLQIGLHQDVEVTSGETDADQILSQIFCSALPVSYCTHPTSAWKRFARFILAGAYEATMLAAVLNAARGASNIVLLTRLGGGAFGNESSWIDAAMSRALLLVKDFELEVRLVSFGPPPDSMLAMEKRFA